MAFSATKVYASQMAANDGISGVDSCGLVSASSRPIHHGKLKAPTQRVENRKLKNGSSLCVKISLLPDGYRHVCTRRRVCDISSGHVFSCKSMSTQGGETKEHALTLENSTDKSRDQAVDGNVGIGSQVSKKVLSRRGSTNTSPGIAEACKYVYNDAKFVNERARNDIVLLSRGITRLNDRARQDVAVLGVGFLKLDARAREDTEKIDSGLKKKAARLHHVATILKNKAESKLKTVADQHWSDGALEADLRRADILVRRRAMEDAFMALKFVRNIHDMMVNKQLLKEDDSFTVDDLMGYITLERNGKSFDLFAGDISTDRITALQEAYWSMASALSEADGIDYNDPDELELLVATLIDLDAMDGKSSVSLLAECSSSPDVNTRKALANALAAAPSMWTLGNAGMGALQRLAEDSNPAVAAAASNAIDQLRRQWEIQEGDSLTFRMGQNHHDEDDDESESYPDQE